MALLCDRREWIIGIKNSVANPFGFSPLFFVFHQHRHGVAGTVVFSQGKLTIGKRLMGTTNIAEFYWYRLIQ